MSNERTPTESEIFITLGDLPNNDRCFIFGIFATYLKLQIEEEKDHVETFTSIRNWALDPSDIPCVRIPEDTWINLLGWGENMINMMRSPTTFVKDNIKPFMPDMCGDDNRYESDSEDGLVIVEDGSPGEIRIKSCNVIARNSCDEEKSDCNNDGDDLTEIFKTGWCFTNYHTSDSLS